jgi:GNAT superfamily N-acetyltransferase
MLKARVLPPEEWSKLEGVDNDLATVWRQLPIGDVTVLVVEDSDGVIVATWTTFACWHVEGFWVEPAHRKRGVAIGRLVEAMRNLMQVRGVQHVMTGAPSPEIVTLLEHVHATKLPGEYFVLPTRKSA